MSFLEKEEIYNSLSNKDKLKFSSWLGKEVMEKSIKVNICHAQWQLRTILRQENIKFSKIF